MDAAERAYQTLANLIAHGEFSPGTRLGEEMLAARIGVSRTPIREALQRLSAEGAVLIRPHRGAEVVSFSATDLDGLFDVRAELEPLAVSLAVPRLTEEDLEALAMWNDEMAEIAIEDDRDALRLTELNRAFHARFFERSGSKTLAGVLQDAIRPAIVSHTFGHYSREDLQRSMSHHAEILEAASVQDSGWASAVMKAHILAARHTWHRHAPGVDGSE